MSHRFALQDHRLFCLAVTSPDGGQAGVGFCEIGRDLDGGLKRFGRLVVVALVIGAFVIEASLYQTAK
jgi:hypothetical protein